MALKLRDYQEQAVDFLYERDHAMILAPVGAGKTAITLTAMQELVRDRHAKRWLVLAPKRVCTDVWPVEAPKWAPKLRIALAVGSPAQRRAAFESNAHVVVTNYDNLQSLPAKLAFDGLIADELTRLKNPSGKRFKALMDQIDTFRFRWGLTGSFTSNGLEDVFGQCKIIDEKLLGRSKGAFLQKYFVLLNRDFGEWRPRRGALEQIMTAIRPATFVLEPGAYADKLPPLHVVEMRCDMDDMKPYNDMKRRFVLEMGKTEITAPSAAAVTTKLQQLSCIAEGTPVLTERGWMPIERVQDERIWDGVEWVRHEGVIFQGIKEIALCNGVRMTYDHKILTVEGWKTAKEILYADASRRFDRETVRLPDGSVSRWCKPVQMRSMALPLRLWQRSDTDKPVFARSGPQTTPKLWLSSRQRNASHDAHSPIQDMEEHAAQVQRHHRERLRSLWRARHICVRAVARLQCVLARYAGQLRAAFHVRPHRQQRALLAEKLSLGKLDYASQQQKQQSVDRDPRGFGYNLTSGARAEYAGSNASCADRQVRMDGREGVKYARTYDILNCGPRNRFVVHGENDELLIVHNCGFIYESLRVASERPGHFDTKQTAHWLSHHKFEMLDEILEGNQHADTIVIYNFKEELAELRRRYPHAKTLDEPDAVQKWNNGKISMLLLHPKSAGHGLNLQYNKNGNKIVFLSLPWSLELFEQTVGRLHRGGQTQDVWCYVVMCNKTIDERIWTALHDKRAVSDIALEELKSA